MYKKLILEKLGVSEDALAKKKHGESTELSYGFLIDRLLENRGKEPAYKTLGIPEQTFNRMIKKVFPGVKLAGGRETWFYYILSIIEYKNCSQCDSILAHTEFHKDTDASAVGLKSICKHCVSVNQAGQYKKYYDSHQKSYEKNKGKIKERNSISKFERSLRVVPWTETRQIQEFYDRCPAGYQVDHIIPLLGKEVSGLHVLSNLQYLPALDNMRKSNKYNTT